MPEYNKTKRILIVEDEHLISMELKQLLNEMGFFQIDRTSTGEEAVKLARTQKPDLILMDIKLTEAMDGISSAEEILSNQNTAIVYLTAFDDEETIERVKLTRPYGYLLKPFKKHELEVCVETALYKHQISKKLSLQEKKYRTLFNKSTIGICLFNSKGLLEEINEAACKMLGINNQQDITGFQIAADPNIGALISESLSTPRKKQVNIKYNFDMIRKKNVYKTIHRGVHFFQIHIIPLFAESANKADGILVYILNNSESQLTEEKRGHEKELLDSLMENIPDKIYFKNTKSRFIKISHNHAELFDIHSEDDAIGKTDFDFFSDEHAQQAFDDEQRIIKTRMPIINLEEKETWPDGSVSYVSSSKVPVYDKSDNVIGIVGISRDITDLKQSREALSKSEKRYRELFDEAPVGYHELDTNGIIRDVNQSEARMLGYTKAEMIGKSIFEFLPAKFRKEAKSQFSIKLKMKSEGKGFERTCLKKSGKPIELYIQDKLVKNADGDVTGIRSTLQDISELKKTERQLKKTANELKDSNQELEQFAYVASHDLQEPLRMVASYVQLLEKRYADQLDDDARVFINFAVDGAKRMQGLINALLIYSRAGTKNKPFAKIETHTLLQHVLSDLMIKIKETEAEIQVGSLPDIYADETQIHQVFQNLLGNALKFTEEKKPVIHISSAEEPDHMHFTVKDNGIGIEEAYKERIFMVFQRLHTRQQYEGTGIGLAVCKKIIERHGGNIWIEPNPEGGTIFHFTIRKEEIK